MKVCLNTLIWEDWENITDENKHTENLFSKLFPSSIFFFLTGKKFAVILELKRKKL